MQKRLLIPILLLLASALYSQQPKLVLPIGHTNLVNDAVYSHDGTRVATASVDHTAKIWDLASGKLLYDLKGHTDEIISVSFSHNDSRILTYANDGALALWNAKTGALIKIWGNEMGTLHGISGEVSMHWLYYNAAFSPDDKWILHVNRDSLLLFQAIDGKLLAKEKISEEFLSTARFSPDGKTFVTITRDFTAKIWQILSVQGHLTFVPLHTLSTNQKGIPPLTVWGSNEGARWTSDIKFSNDGKWLVTAHGFANYIQVFDAHTGTWQSDMIGHTKRISSVEFSTDGSMLVTGSQDGMVKNWDTKTGKLLYTFPSRDSAYLALPDIEKRDMYHESTAQFSPDGNKILVSEVNWGDTIFINLWDSHSGNFIKNIYQSKRNIRRINFNKDGSRLLFAMNENMAIIKDLDKLNTQLELKGHTNFFDYTCFNPDGSILVTVILQNKRAYLWNAQSGSLIRMIDLPDAFCTSDFDLYGRFRLSKDGKMLISPGAEYRPTQRDKFAFIYKLGIWELKSGRMLYNMDIGNEELIDIQYDAEKKYAFTGKERYYFNDSILTGPPHYTKWDIVSGKPVQSDTVYGKLFSENPESLFAEYNSDSTRLLTSMSANSVTVKEVRTGNIIRTFKGYKGYPIQSAHFSPDGKGVLISSGEVKNGLYTPSAIKYGVYSVFEEKEKDTIKKSEVALWEIISGKKLLGFSEKDSTISTQAYYSRDGKKVIAYYDVDSIKVWDSRTGKMLNNVSMFHYSDYLSTPGISSNGKQIAYLDDNDQLQIFDGYEGKFKHTVIPQNALVNSITFSPDGSSLTTTASDHTLQKWETATGKLLYTFYVIDSTDYLVVDNFGRYDGTDIPRRSLFFTCNDEIIDLEQFEKLCWEPGLVSKLQGYNKEQITAKKLSDISICNFTPEVEQKGLVNGNYNYLISERNGGIGEIQLFINGKLVKNYQPGKLTKEGLHQYRLSVPAKELERYFASGIANRITVKATTKDSSMTSRGGEGEGPVLDNKKGNPNMYIVSIGINDYKGQELKLRYASTDAESFASVLTPAAKKLLNTDSVQHVKSYVFSTEENNPNKPYKQAIKERFIKIAAESTADDILVIFFAGHGVLQGGQKTFYLLTQDAAAFNLTGVEKDVAISFEELSELMRNIVANKQVLIIDACNSGQAVDAQQLLGKREIPADLARAQENLRDQTGTYILAASASGRPAFEATQFGQGLLTYSLLSGIKNQDGLTENKFIGVTQWFNAALKTVTELAREVGDRQDPKIIGNGSFAVGMVDPAMIQNIKLANRKKVFARSFLFKTTDMIDNLHLSNTVDSVLNIRSAMGVESPLSFIEANTSPDAYSIRGSYLVENGKLTVKISLIHNDNKETDFEKTGSVNERGTIALGIVAEVVAFLKNNTR